MSAVSDTVARMTASAVLLAALVNALHAGSVLARACFDVWVAHPGRLWMDAGVGMLVGVAMIVRKELSRLFH